MGIGYYEGQLGVNRTLVQNDNYFYGGPDSDDAGESVPRGQPGSKRFQLNVGKGLSDKSNYKNQSVRHHCDFDNDVTNMANLEIKESKKNKEFKNN